MNGRNTFSLLFYVRTNRPDKTGLLPLYMRITCAGVTTAISLNRRVDPQFWDPNQGRMKPRVKGSKEINALIESFHLRALEAQRRLISEGRVVTSEAIVSLVLGRENREFTVLKLMERHNDQMEKSLGITSTYGNFKNYKTTLHYLREFISVRYQRKDFFLTELDNGFIESFLLFLQKDKPCHHNGAMKHLQRLNKVVNIGINNKWINTSPFPKVKIRFNPYDKVILTFDEVIRIENLDLKNKKLELTRDVFIFGCYTGLSYIDVKNLSHENVITWIDGNQWIFTHRQKTRVKSRIPLLPKAIKIIEKYKDHPKRRPECVLPIYSNQKTNDYLKEIATLAGIKKRLTFHTARHIFATVVTLANGVPIETVSKALGHSNIRTTQIYAKILDEKLSQDFDKLKTLLNKLQPQYP